LQALWNKLEFYQAFISELSEENWKDFRDFFYSYKAGLSENPDVNNIEIDFSSNEYKIENEGYMCGYQEIFPYCKTFKVKFDNITYLIYDQYCLASTCNCTDAGLSVIEISENGDRIRDGYDATSIVYDYKEGKREIKREDKRAKYSIQKIFEKLHRENPDIDNIFRNRHNNLRRIYLNYRRKYKSNRSITNNTGRKVGRNDPCPCGSGKKYKYCCGA